MCAVHQSLENCCPPEDNIVADSMHKKGIQSGCSYTSTNVFILFHSYNLIPFTADADRVVLSKDHDQQYYINACFFGCMRMHVRMHGDHLILYNCNNFPIYYIGLL